MPARLFLDECLSPGMVHALYGRGAELVLHPRDHGGRGDRDDEILARCIRDDLDCADVCAATGNSGQGSSFQSVNYPGHDIRHYDSTGYIASDGGSNPWDNANSWTDDTSWIVTAPLAN